MGKKRNTNKVTLAVPLSVAAIGGGKGGGSIGGPDPSDTSDLESVYSASVVGEGADSDNENDFASLVDSFGDLVENAQDKRIETRLRAIDSLLLVLNKNCIPESVEKWRGTLAEIILVNLKRTSEEATRVCSLAALLSLHLGVGIEEDICEIVNLMRQICSDVSASEVVRSSCAQAIGLCVYLSVESHNDRLESMQTLKSIWSAMKPAGVGGTSLFSSALASWSLLLERFDSVFISTQIGEMQPRICSFLESTTVEARISAGEALMILHEIGVENIDDEFQFSNQNYLKQILGNLAADSSKNRAKRDKKLQKLTFRHINDVICNEKLEQLSIRFNKRETLDIQKCHQKLLYDLLCQLLKSDLNGHLTKNLVLRELFDLGPVMSIEEPVKMSKSQKIERLVQFGEQKKQMNINRSKGRAKKNDHKHALIEYED
uniref:Interferon-related developmental regulator N-terminal domain-containing protein n=1 Tax=Meloidogyne incognita TaxID=6306 RepID=A0A914KUH9_MELIC